MRYMQHLQDGCAPNPKPTALRCQWLTELRRLRTAPRLCIIEQIGLRPQDLSAREFFWIAEYQSVGEAWLNARVSKHALRLRDRRPAMSLSDYKPDESAA